jgi:hypothetical protein
MMTFFQNLIVIGMTLDTIQGGTEVTSVPVLGALGG